jgi:hypothetical protein
MTGEEEHVLTPFASVNREERNLVNVNAREYEDLLSLKNFK